MNEGEPKTAPDGQGGDQRFGEGYSWQEGSPESLAEVVEGAFDYRGDVTLLLEGGEALVGYVGNRYPSETDPHLVIFPADGGAPRRIPYRSIRGVRFTGRDAASGRSWETWVTSYEAKKRARESGEPVGEIGLFPDPLE